MVDADFLNSEETAARLGVTLNNLRQLQFRKQLIWRMKISRSAQYGLADIEAFEAIRKLKKDKREIRQNKSK